MGVIHDLTGKQFGRLAVLGRGSDYIQKNGRHRVMWSCRCDCGNIVDILGENLRKGASQSCGCYRHDKLSEIKSTHHETNTKLYGVWCSIKARCYNRNSKPYKSYGGRGIIMCDEWRDSYEKFREWAVSSGYSSKLSIDRIDNNGPYSPDNCRWVDMRTQANNRRSNVYLTLCGETHNITEWAKIIDINPKVLFSRYYSGKSVEDILKK